MSADADDAAETRAQAEPDQPYFDKALGAFRDLFDKARAAHELHFVMALVPEFRGLQDAGWNTAGEAVRAYDEFVELIKSLDPGRLVRARIILSFYLHVSEGSGFWEIPKKLLLTAGGNGNNITPFQNLVDKHRLTGEVIAPNANRIMKDLIGHASDLGFKVLRDAFDPDIRNAVAHADYILWQDGMRLRRRNGGFPRIVSWKEFDLVVSRGLNIFNLIRELAGQYTRSYDPPKVIRARMHESEPETDYTLYYDPGTGSFGLTTGGKPGTIPE
jgi:hypothetical protein